MGSKGNKNFYIKFILNFDYQDTTDWLKRSTATIGAKFKLYEVFES